MTYLKWYLSRLLPALFIGLSAYAWPVAAIGQTRTLSTPAASLESAIGRADWSTVAKLTATSKTLHPVVLRLLKAHALLGLNQSNEAVCLFMSVTAPADLARWEAWTRGLATRGPQSASGHYLLGDALARQRRWAEAFQSFQAALDHDPRFAMALNARAVTYAVTGDVDRARLDLKSAAEVSPLLGDVHLTTGYLNIQRNVATGARNAFMRALQLMPDSALATGGLGYVQVIENRWSGGKHDIEAAGNRSACLASLLADNLGSLVQWESQSSAVLLARADTRDLGTTLNEMLMRVGQGDPKAVHEVHGFVLEHPDTQPKVSLTYQSMNNTNPTARKVLETELPKIAAAAEQRADQLRTIDTIKSSSSLGLDLSAKLGKVGGGVGAKTGAEVTKSGELLREQNNKELELTNNLKKVVPGSQKSPGGLTTLMPAADRGHWPIQPHYTLAYSAGAVVSQ